MNSAIFHGIGKHIPFNLSLANDTPTTLALAHPLRNLTYPSASENGRMAGIDPGYLTI